MSQLLDTVEDAERRQASPRVLEWGSRPLPGPDGEWACPLPPGLTRDTGLSQKINTGKTVRGLGAPVCRKKMTRSQSKVRKPIFFSPYRSIS